MKKLAISLGVILVFLVAINVQAGQPFGAPRHWIAPPNSMAFSKSLDDWMLAYMGWLDAGADPAARIRNVAFLPIIPGPEFEVEVKVGTALVLPIATWLGEDENDTLPDEWFGDPLHVFGELSLNGGPIVDINEDYYVGPTPIEPPLFDAFVLYQALACMRLYYIRNLLTSGWYLITPGLSQSLKEKAKKWGFQAASIACTKNR